MVISGGGFYGQDEGLQWTLKCVDWAGWARKICETNKIEHVFDKNTHANSRDFHIKCAY